MNRLKTLRRAAGIALLAAALLTIHAQPAGPQNTKTRPVQVTYTPLPVQGTVTIGNAVMGSPAQATHLPSEAPPPLRAMQEGSKPAGERQLVGPPGMESPAMAIIEWRRKHPRPKPDDPPEARKAYYKALRTATDEWLKQWPGRHAVIACRLEALAGDEDVPASELEEAAEAAIKAEASSPGRVVPPPLITQVAEIYAQRGIKLDQVPKMARQGLEWAEQGPFGLSALAAARQMPVEMKSMRLEALRSTRWMGWNATVVAYLKLKQPAQARETLREMEKWLRENKPSEDDQRALANYPGRQVTYWSGMAQLAEHEGRKLDALACHQMALGIWRDSPAATAKARGLWKELGGTNEGWQTFLAGLERREAGPAATITGPQWTKVEKPLPKFELQDPSGKTWRLAQFEGKTLFVSLWATWCAPCLAELPYIQKLHERVQDRSDLAVVSLNIDEDTGLVQRFLDGKKYTFPVLLAKAYVEGVLPETGLPRNWIVDGKGVWKLDLRGLGLNLRLDKLVDEALEVMQKAK